MPILYNGINIHANNIISKTGKIIKTMKWYVFACNEEVTSKDANRTNTDKNGVHDSLIVPSLLLVIIHDI